MASTYSGGGNGVHNACAACPPCGYSVYGTCENLHLLYAYDGDEKSHPSLHLLSENSHSSSTVRPANPLVVGEKVLPSPCDPSNPSEVRFASLHGIAEFAIECDQAHPPCGVFPLGERLTLLGYC